MFHKTKTSYPEVRVRDGRESNQGLPLSRKNLVKYELTKAELSKRKQLNAARRPRKGTFTRLNPLSFWTVHLLIIE